MVRQLQQVPVRSPAPSEAPLVQLERLRPSEWRWDNGVEPAGLSRTALTWLQEVYHQRGVLYLDLIQRGWLEELVQDLQGDQRLGCEKQTHCVLR